MNNHTNSGSDISLFRPKEDSFIGRHLGADGIRGVAFDHRVNSDDYREPAL
jgi:hypothetical protein